MADSIDELQIEITGESKSAQKGLDGLIATLGKLRTATRGGAGLKSLATRIGSLGTAAESANEPLERFSKTLEAIKSLESVGKIRLGALTNGLKRLPEVAREWDTVDMDSFATKVTEITAPLKDLEGIGRGQINSALNSLRKIPDLAKNLAEVDMEGFTNTVSSLVRTLEPLQTMGKSQMNSVLNSLRKIPEISKQLADIDLNKFTEQIERLATALRPLADEMSKVGAGFAAFPSKLQRVMSQNNRLAASNKKLSESYNPLRGVLSRFEVQLGKIILGAGLLGRKLGTFIEESNAYVENLNLFEVAMGQFAEQSLRYAERVQDAMGVDVSEFIRNQGIFKQIATGFGVVEEQAYTMSKTLTELSYDMASFFNIKIDEAFLKVQSGISGELEPLRRLGYALDVATLKQVALNHGITQNVNTMTQAQKAQLRFIAIMEQSGNVLGDMGRTLITPANALRILNQQMVQLRRALGDMIIPLLIKILPYVQAVVKVLTELARGLATLFGFELPKIDYSSLQSGVSGIGEAADEATESMKKLRKQVAGFDQLNLIGESPGSGAVDVPGSSDLGIDLSQYEYDFLGEVESRVDEIADKIKRPFIELAEFLQPFAQPVFETISDSFEKLKDLVVNNKDAMIAGLGGIAAGFISLWAAMQGPAIISGVSGAFSTLLGVIGRFGPVGLIIAAVIGAITAGFLYFYRTNEEFRDTVHQILAKIGETASWLWEDVLKPLSHWLKGVFVAAWDGVTLAARWLWTNVLVPFGDFLKWLWERVLKPTGAVLADVLAVAFETVSDIAKSFWKNVLVPLGDFFKEAFGPTVEAISAVLKVLWEKVMKPFATFIKNVFKRHFEDATDSLEFLWHKVLKPLVTFIGGRMKSVFDETFKLVGELIDGAKTTFIGLMEFITGTFTGDWERAWNGVKQIFEGIFNSLWAIVKRPLNSMIDGLNTVIRGVNKLSFEIPDWVSYIPGIPSELAGTKLGFNIPTIPKLEVGTNYVPRDMLAYLHKGEAVVPKAYNPAINNKPEDGSGLGDVVRMLERVERAIRENKTVQAVIAEGDVGRASVNYIRGETRRGRNPLMGV